jgi:hypothetical protein
MRCGRWKNAFAKRKRRHNAEFAEKNRELRKSRGGQDARWQPRDFCILAIKRVANGETVAESWRYFRGHLGGEVACLSRANIGADSWRWARWAAAQVRGGAFAYWYLRRHGYVFVARNYVPREIKRDQPDHTMKRWRL